MKKKYILKTFIKFLKKNDVYNAYIYSLKLSKNSNIAATKFIINTINRDPNDLIVAAFAWYTSPNQKKSWSELHDEWCYLINKS